MIKDSEASFMVDDSLFRKNMTAKGKSITTLSKRSGTSMFLNKLGEKNVVCQIHSKYFEAFCFEDKKLLCVDCILDKAHKNHWVKTIEESFAKLKKKLNQKVASCSSQKHALMDTLPNQLQNAYETLKNNFEYHQKKIILEFDKML